ncbi:MAG: hypothetical protein AAF228_03775 [Pseudomonadota bacterium]
MEEKQPFIKTPDVDDRHALASYVKQRTKFKMYQFIWLLLGMISVFYLFNLALDITEHSPTSPRNQIIQTHVISSPDNAISTTQDTHQMRHDINSLKQDIGALNTQIQRLKSTKSSGGRKSKSLPTKKPHKPNYKDAKLIGIKPQSANLKYAALPRNKNAKSSFNTRELKDVKPTRIDGYIIDPSQKENLTLARQFTKSTPSRSANQVTPRKTSKNKTIAELSIKKTYFGIQIKQGRTYRAMRSHWKRLVKQYPDRLRDLKPRVVRDKKNKKNHLQLITGPFSNVAKALEVCAIIKRKLNCELTLYTGRKL